MTSMFSSRQPSYSQDPKESMTSQNSYANHPEEKRYKNYPPTSMAGPVSNDSMAGPRPSTESSRRTSFGFSRRNTNNSGSADTGKSSRRFSLLPSSLSKTFSSQRESLPAKSSYDDRRASSRPRAGSKPPAMAYGRGESRSPSQSTTGSNMPGFYDGQHDSSSRVRAAPTSAPTAGPSSAPPQQTHFDSYPATAPLGDDKIPPPRDTHPSMQNRRPTDDSSERNNPYPQGMGGEEQAQRKGVLQKSRKFGGGDAYEGDGGNKGSSGSSKRVMDFFRRMGKQRAGTTGGR
jgi:protein-serine/threonine kinase